MKRIAISIVTLFAGGILSAQISPQGAQKIQSQARSATQPAQPQTSPIQHQAMRLPVQNAPKPTATVKPQAQKAAQKVSAATTSQAKASGKTPAVAAVKPVTTKAPGVKPQPVPKTAVAKTTTTAPKPVKVKAGPKVAAKPAVKKTSEPEPAKVKEAMIKTEKPVEEKPLQIDLTSRRDPFTSPVMRNLNSTQGPNCSSGKHCLAVDQILLRGIVRSPNGMIAVVENGAKRAYFLRENDPVWHGVVEKINGDSVVFREETVDSKTGKPSTNEVVKRVNAPVV